MWVKKYEFSRKIGLRQFSLSMFPSLQEKKSEKSNEPIPRKVCCGLTD